MDKTIITKLVNDEHGDFNHVELCQGDQKLVISLGATALDSEYHSYKWDHLRRVIDSLQNNIREQAERKKKQ